MNIYYWKKYGRALNQEQIKGIAEISRDIGQVCLASIVIPAFVPGFQETNAYLIALGFMLMVLMWGASIFLLKRT
jgi:hypothetical protein